MNETDVKALVQTIVDLAATWGLKVLGALVVLVVGRLISGWARRLSRRALERSRVDNTLIPFISSLVYYLLLAFTVVATLGIVGVQTASIIAVMGAAGLAVGLALQGTLSHFSAGVMLLLFRPFKLGDYVDAGGTAGSVKAIGIFSTVLTTPDNVQIVVPNAAVWGSVIKNYTTNDTRRNDMVVGISHGDDIGLAIDVINKTLALDQRVLSDPMPVVAVGEIADSSVDLVVRPWCRKEDYWDLRFDLTRKLKEDLEAAGCSIPFPQHDVHVIGSDQAA